MQRYLVLTSHIMSGVTVKLRGRVRGGEASGRRREVRQPQRLRRLLALHHARHQRVRRREHRHGLRRKPRLKRIQACVNIHKFLLKVNIKQQKGSIT